MSGTFDRYALVYDRVYADKDYLGEARFVTRLLGGDPADRALLDIGCGTGRHLSAFATLGFRPTGVDASPGMAKIAAARQPAAAIHVGDARQLDLKCRFDVAVSLFHVVSYLADPTDLTLALLSVRRHLLPGGRFLFDFWHDAGVEADPPVTRERHFTIEGGSFVRRSIPTWDRSGRTVTVRIEIDAEGPAFSGTWSTSEQHRMRYFAIDELAEALACSNFRLLGSGAWMEDRPLASTDWNGWVMAEAI